MAEARVRTLEEAQNLPDDEVSWIEVKKGTSTEYLVNNSPKGMMYTFLWPENYEIEWRVWDGKPTAKQRRATQWKQGKV